jgi:hypothetical protein
MDKDLMRKEVSVQFHNYMPYFRFSRDTRFQNLGNFGLDNSVDAEQVSQAAQAQEKEKAKYRQGWVAGTEFRKTREARKAAECAEAGKTQDT